MFKNLSTARVIAYQILLFFLVHGWLLLNKSYFWDDWVWKPNPQAFYEGSVERGVVFFKEFFFWLYTLENTALVTKSFVFICFLFSVIFLYGALNKLLKNKTENLPYIGFLLAVFPFYIIGRSTLCTAPYALSFVLFAGAYFFYSLFRAGRGQKLLLMPVIILSTLSFNTTSFVVIYVALFSLTEILLFEDKKKAILGFLKVGILTSMHVIVFYAAKLHYFPVHGYYANYNQIKITLKSFYHVFVSASPASFLQPLSFSFFGKDLALLLKRSADFIFTLGFYFPLFWAYRKKENRALKYSLIGILLIMAAVFPYVMVNKIPHAFSWDSRHELLLPIGAAFWFLSIFQLMPSLKSRNILCLFLVAIFSWGSIRLYLSVQGLHFQQKALQEGLLSHVDGAQPGAYIFIDQIKAPGVMSHHWDFYYLTGMLNLKFKNQATAIISEREKEYFNNPESRERFFTERYLLANAKWEAPFYCLTMSGKEHLSELDALSLLIKEMSSSEEALVHELMSLYQFKKTMAKLEDGKPICLNP